MIEVPLSGDERWLLVAALDAYEAFCDEHRALSGDDVVARMIADGAQVPEIKAALAVDGPVELSSLHLRAAALALFHLQLVFAQLAGRLDRSTAWSGDDRVDGIERLRRRLSGLRAEMRYADDDWDVV